MELPIEVKIIHHLPKDLSSAIGRIIVAHSKLEHQLSALIAILLHLHRSEARLAVRSPRTQERLDIVCDLLALRGIDLDFDYKDLRSALDSISSRRDLIAHGIYLKHKGTIYLQITRGQWPRNLTRGERINRTIYPQSIPITSKYCLEILKEIESAMKKVDAIGFAIDAEMKSSPQKFRQLALIEDHLARRKKDTPKRP